MSKKKNSRPTKPKPKEKEKEKDAKPKGKGRRSNGNTHVHRTYQPVVEYEVLADASLEAAVSHLDKKASATVLKALSSLLARAAAAAAAAAASDNMDAGEDDSGGASDDEIAVLTRRYLAKYAHLVAHETPSVRARAHEVAAALVLATPRDEKQEMLRTALPTMWRRAAAERAVEATAARTALNMLLPTQLKQTEALIAFAEDIAGEWRRLVVEDERGEATAGAAAALALALRAVDAYDAPDATSRRRARIHASVDTLRHECEAAFSYVPEWLENTDDVGVRREAYAFVSRCATQLAATHGDDSRSGGGDADGDSDSGGCSSSSGEDMMVTQRKVLHAAIRERSAVCVGVAFDVVIRLTQCDASLWTREAWEELRYDDDHDIDEEEEEEDCISRTH